MKYKISIVLVSFSILLASFIFLAPVDEKVRFSPSDFFGGHCYIDQDCGNDLAVISLNGEENAQISLDLEFYDYNLCCPLNTDSEIFECQENSIFTYNRDNNAHVGLTGYDNAVCFSEFEGSCNFLDDCGSDGVCILEVSSLENAHVAECGSDTYSKKICCGNTEIFYVNETSTNESIPSDDEPEEESTNQDENSNQNNEPYEGCSYLDQCEKDSDCIVGICNPNSCKCESEKLIELDLGNLDFIIPMILVVLLGSVIFIYYKKRR